MRKLGFSLIELLVVVSIIAVLIALVLPSLKKAKEATLTVRCLSNQRQAGVLMHTYAMKTNGLIPSRGGSLKKSPLLSWWPQLLDEELGQDPNGNHEAYFCPANLPKQYAPKHCYGVINFLWPKNLKPWIAPGSGSTGFHQYLIVDKISKSSSNFALMADTCMMGGWPSEIGRQISTFRTDTLWSSFGVHTRHMGAANILALDGHAQTVLASELEPSFDITTYYKQDFTPHP